LQPQYLFLQGCGKSESPTEDLYQKYFETNVLNSDFIVSLATDNGNNLMANTTVGFSNY
jgi:hypothetical protein